EAEASVVPSGDTESATTGAVWPASTIDGCGAPGVQIAMRASSPLVAIRPSARKAAALTAPSWKRSTCSAAFFDSDQRIAEVSKLPETACVPSGEIASARTGPPWPRNCACAMVGATDRSSVKTARTRNIIASLKQKSGIGRAHAERADFLAHSLIAQRSEKRRDRGAVVAAFDQEKVVIFGRDRQEAEAIKTGNRFDGDAPICAALPHRGGDGVGRARMVAIARGPRAVEQPVGEHARSGAGIAVDHQAVRIAECGCQCIGCALPGKAGVVEAVHEALHPLPALHQRETAAQQVRVVD